MYVRFFQGAANMRQLFSAFLLTLSFLINSTYAFQLESNKKFIEINDLIKVNLSRKVDGGNGALVYQDQDKNTFCELRQVRKGYVWTLAEAGSQYQVMEVLKNTVNQYYYELTKISGTGENKLILFCQSLTEISKMNSYFYDGKKSIINIQSLSN